MNTDIILSVLSLFTGIFLCVTLVYVIGIVWRVELELDLSYKLLSVALVCLIVAGALETLPVTYEDAAWAIALRIVKLLAAFFLFAGMYYMRDLIRRLDGEKPGK